MEIEVKGLDRLMKKLDAIASQQAITEALLDLGGKIQEAAKEATPVDTGNLRASITVASSSPDTVTVGTNVDYAVYVEYGTGQLGDPTVPHTERPYWRYKGKDGQWVTSHGHEPQPFMRPAAERGRELAPEIVKKKLEAKIKEAGG